MSQVFQLEEPPAPPRATEADMVRLLDQRYTRVRPYTTADRYVRMAQTRISQSFDFFRDHRGQLQPLRIADYLVIDKYPSQQALHGFEIKVSRSDWLSELRDPEKSAPWRCYCNYWWIVTSDKAVCRPEELPDGYGLLIATSTLNVLRCTVKATRSDAPPLPLDLVAGIAYAAQSKPHAVIDINPTHPSA